MAALITFFILHPFDPVAAFGTDSTELSRVTGTPVIELDMEDITEVKPANSLFGIQKNMLLKISGPIIWFLILTGIGIRKIKMKGKARLLNRWHKRLGYLALGIGTLHGAIGLFL